MKIEITAFRSRTNPRGVVRTITWEELKNRLRKPVVTDETMAEYCAMTNEQRTDVKDVGGFVGGRMRDGNRSKTALENRTLLTIDADDANPQTVPDFELINSSVFCCHTTHSSTKDSLRLRWVFPLSRPVSPAEYKVIAGEVSKWVGADTIDDTTDQPERLMFWPSVAFDADFHFWEGGTDVLDPDEILDAADPIPEEPAPQKTENSDSGELTSIPEGGRNKSVFAFASVLRGQGLDYQGIRSIVSDYNERYCNPALPEAELDTICRSVCSRFKRGDPIGSLLRTAWDDFNDLGEWKETAPKKVETIMVESAASLNARFIAPPTFVIPGIIPCGLTILASPPKFGKSWMCLDMAISVATGTRFMGLETTQSGVIYLALEDGDYRLQERSRKVAGDRGLPANLLLAKQSPTIPEGLLPQLAQLVDTCQVNPGLLIIDTLQKIRGVSGKTEGAYGYDYRELGQLHQFALDKSLALVIVHHLNKGGDDSDFVSRLNGTTGISGAADSIITLTRSNRGSDETKMSITGRDVQERTLIIQMDWSNYRWILLGDERDVEKDRDSLEFQSDPIVKTILWHMADAEEVARADEAHDWPEAVWCCTSGELKDEVKRLFGQEYESSTAVGMAVKKLLPQLEAREGIGYEYQRTSTNRKHVFKREII